MTSSALPTLHLDGSEKSIETAAELLRAGEVVGLPTETVYGLAGNAFSTEAIKKIFAAKERPSFDPLIVHVKASSTLASLVSEQIVGEEVLQWPHRSLVESAFQKFWPGPLTFILPRGSRIPDEVTSAQPTVGIRMPHHPLFQAVLQECEFPLAAPSANRFGRISPTTAQHVFDELEGRIAGVLDGGACTIGVESTIVRIENPLKVTLLRPGKISSEELSAHFGIDSTVQRTVGQKNNEAQLAPGMLEEHYAPRKPLILIPHSFDDSENTLAYFNQHHLSGKVAFLAMVWPPSFIKDATLHGFTLSPSEDLGEMAQHLFARLRELDANPNVDWIIADLPGDIQNGIGRAIADRLNRASRNKPL